ncbi:MAG: hypothetical protein AAFX03_08625 [Pseudomonadota bacterium]
MKLNELSGALRQAAASAAVETRAPLDELAGLFEELGDLEHDAFLKRARRFRAGGKAANGSAVELDEAGVAAAFEQLRAAGPDAAAAKAALETAIERFSLRNAEIYALANLYTGHRGAFPSRAEAVRQILSRARRYEWDAEAFETLRAMRPGG